MVIDNKLCLFVCRGVLDTTLCDKVLSVHYVTCDRSVVSTTDNIDSHDTTEKLLKVALNTISHHLIRRDQGKTC